MIQLELTTQFSCAHFYSRSDWDETRNRLTFGKCFSKHGHGHDYSLSVTIEIDPNSLETNEHALQKALGHIHDEFDHKHLNYDFAEFAKIIPTTENISLVLSQRLKKLAPTLKFQQLRLFERPDLFVEFKF